VSDEAGIRAAVIARLRAAGCVFAEDEAALLLEAAGSAAELDRLVARRVAGEPLEPLLGFAEFGGLRIHVAAGVFVPRRRTQLLAAQAALLARRGDAVLDLCCGAGAIGAVIAARVPGAVVHAADVDPAAVRAARVNLDPGRVYQGDLFDAVPGGLRGALAVVAVNAPYVPTEAIALMPLEAREHEPAVALDGGPDGLDLHRRIAAEVGAWLTPGGSVLIETSDEQSASTLALFEAAGLPARIVADDELDATAVVATRPGGGRHRSTG
jgi:release factor glutamine methyltransferase